MNEPLTPYEGPEAPELDAGGSQSAGLEAAEAGELAPDEFYFEGPYMVFTGVHHLKRGYCCNSDCRHCPYK